MGPTTLAAGPARGLRRRGAAALAGLAVFATLATVYLRSGQRNFYDPRYALLTSEALLRDGSWNLAPYLPATLEELRARRAGGAHRRTNWHLALRDDGRLLYVYPPGAPLFSVPLLAAARACGASTLTAAGLYSPAAERRLQALFAALVTAATAVVVLRLAARELPLGAATAVALVAGLGSELWSLASRYLWSHTFSTFWIAVVLAELLRWEDGERRRPALAGFALAAAFWSRPTAALVVVAATLYVALRHRAALLRTLAAGGAGALAYLAYSQLVWGGWTPFYVSRMTARVQPEPLASAYLQLFHGARGLFVLSPILFAVVATLLWRGVAPARRPFAWLALAIVAGHVAFYALKVRWWGGGGVGTRFLVDVVPCLAWFGAHAWRRARDAAAGRARSRLRRWATRGAVAALALASVAGHATGAVKMPWPHATRAAARAAAAGEARAPRAPRPSWQRLPQAKFAFWLASEWWPAHAPLRRAPPAPPPRAE